MGNCSPMLMPTKNGKIMSSENCFEVHSMNVSVLKQSRGTIQLSASNLVFAQPDRRVCITWPLRAIRRFGAHKNVFVFESGRKCSTGPGLFVFKCAQAKLIVDMMTKFVNGQHHLLSATMVNAMKVKRRPNAEHPPSTETLPSVSNQTTTTTTTQPSNDEHCQAISNVPFYVNNDFNEYENDLLVATSPELPNSSSKTTKLSLDELNYVIPERVSTILSVNENKPNDLLRRSNSSVDYSAMDPTKTRAIKEVAVLFNKQRQEKNL